MARAKVPPKAEVPPKAKAEVPPKAGGSRAHLLIQLERGITYEVRYVDPERPGGEIKPGPCVPVVPASGSGSSGVEAGPTPAPPVPRVMMSSGAGEGEGGGGPSTASPPTPSAPGNYRWNAAGCRHYDPPAPGNALCHGNQ